MKLDIPRTLAARVAHHFGPLSPDTILAAVDYGCRRKEALAKDAKRHAAGKLARHLYAPRIDNIERAPRKLAALVDEVRAVGERLAPKGKA